MLFDYRYQKEYLKKKTEFHKDQKYFLQRYFIAVIYNNSVSLLTLTITSYLQIFKAKRTRLFPSFTLLVIIICIACFWKMFSLKTSKTKFFILKNLSPFVLEYFSTRSRRMIRKFTKYVFLLKMSNLFEFVRLTSISNYQKCFLFFLLKEIDHSLALISIFEILRIFVQS